MTTWIEDLVAGPPPSVVKVGNIAPGAPLRVTWEGCDPQEPIRTDWFDTMLGTRSLDSLAGASVLIALADKQPPIAVALLTGGPSNATS